MTRTADARSRTPEHTARLQGYVYRRPLSGPELLPAIGVGVAAGLVAFYVTRLFLRAHTAPPRGTAHGQASRVGTGPSRRDDWWSPATRAPVVARRSDRRAAAASRYRCARRARSATPASVRCARSTSAATRRFRGSELALRISTTASSFARRTLRALGTRRCLDSDELRLDVGRLRLFYRRHGYYNATVDTTRDAVRGRRRASVAFDIDEGAPVLVDSLHIGGLDSATAPIASTENLDLRQGRDLRHHEDAGGDRLDQVAVARQRLSARRRGGGLHGVRHDRPSRACHARRDRRSARTHRQDPRVRRADARRRRDG